jgi:hypothetical protein
MWTASYAADNGFEDFKVLHHYARTGEELGQALSWSRMGGDLKHSVIEQFLGGRLLFVAGERIGWNATLHTGARTWIEVSFAGDVLGEYELKTTDGLSLFPLAMTANGNVYAKIFESSSAAGFAVLDRSKGVWQKVTGDPGGNLIGSEGDNLVFCNLDERSTTLKFAPSSSLRIEEPQQ